jgi:hypothetical protein
MILFSLVLAWLNANEAAMIQEFFQAADFTRLVDQPISDHR